MRNSSFGSGPRGQGTERGRSVSSESHAREKCLQKGFIHERWLGLAGLRAERRARPITCGLVDRGLQLLSARRPHRAQPRSNVKLFQAVVPAARESAAWDVA